MEKKKSSPKRGTIEDNKCFTLIQSKCSAKDSAKDNIGNFSNPEKCAQCESTKTELEKLSTEAKKAINDMHAIQSNVVSINEAKKAINVIQDVLSNILSTISGIKGKLDIPVRDYTAVTECKLFAEETTNRSILDKSPKATDKVEFESFSCSRINKLVPQICKESSINTAKEHSNILEREGAQILLNASDNCGISESVNKHFTKRDSLDEKSTSDTRGMGTSILFDGEGDKQDSSGSPKIKSDNTGSIDIADNFVKEVSIHFETPSVRKKEETCRKKHVSTYFENKTATDGFTEITDAANNDKLENEFENHKSRATQKKRTIEKRFLYKRNEQLIEEYISGLNIIIKETESINNKLLESISNKNLDQRKILLIVDKCFSNFYPINTTVDIRSYLEKCFEYLDTKSNDKTSNDSYQNLKNFLSLSMESVHLNGIYESQREGDHEMKKVQDLFANAYRQVNSAEKNVPEGPSTSNNFEFSNSIGDSKQNDLIFKHSCHLIEITTEYARLNFLKADENSNNINLIQTAELYINVCHSYATTLQAVTIRLTAICKTFFEIVNRTSSTLLCNAKENKKGKELYRKYLQKYQKIMEKNKLFREVSDALLIEIEISKIRSLTLRQIWCDLSLQLMYEFNALTATTIALLSNCYNSTWLLRIFTLDVLSFLSISWDTLNEFRI